MFNPKNLDMKKVVYIGSLIVAAVTAVCDVINDKAQSDKMEKMEKAIESLTGKKL